MILRFCGLAAGPLTICGIVFFGTSPIAPDNGGFTLLDKGSRGSLGELCRHMSVRIVTGETYYVRS